MADYKEVHSIPKQYKMGRREFSDILQMYGRKPVLVRFSFVHYGSFS
jgi:hypothetical protein